MLEETGFTAPPVEQGELPEQVESRWPKVIGVISIIYACGGLLCQTGYGLATFFGDALARMGGMDFTIPLTIKVFAASAACMALGLGIVLLTGGIRLVQRRRSAVKLLKVWVALRLALILYGVVVTVLTAPANIQFQRSMIEAQNDMLRESGQPEIPVPADEQLWRSMMINTGIFSALFAAYPVFVGVYISRRRINQEVQDWR
jgi:hypothetical protein